MKNRKTILVAFVLVACMLIGVGYAELMTTLAINGTAGVSAEAIDFAQSVVFTEAKSDMPAYGTAAVVTGDNRRATFTVTGMTRKDDAVHFTYVILNNSDVDINLSITIAPTTTATNSKFTVTQSLAGGVQHPIKAGETKEVVVTVKLNEDVTAAVDPITYVIEYTASAA